MSNDLINIRFGSWHFHIKRDFPFVEIGHNPFHDRARHEDPAWRWFQIYR